MSFSELPGSALKVFSFKQIFPFCMFFSNQMETCQTFKCWPLLFAT